MIYNVFTDLKKKAINHPMVNMAAFGDISLFDDKATIAYPYVNFDIISSSTKNFIKTYIIRIYVCDRNEPYTAYNKTETILENLLNEIEVETFFVNYFTLNFKDITNGVFCDFTFEVKSNNGAGDCNYKSLSSNLLLENGDYILLENGDFIMLSK